MKMMEHVGTVVAVEGDRAVVELEAGADCGAAASCGCCAGQRSARRLQVERAGLQTGDTVEVSVPAYAGRLRALLVYGLPPAGLVAGLIVGGRYEPAGGANDMGTITGGLAGLLVAGAAALLAGRLLSTGRNRAQVRRVEPGGARSTRGA